MTQPATATAKGPLAGESAGSPLLEVTDLVKHFPIRRRMFDRGGGGGTVQAVDGVSFSVRRGETVGLVGESGCGKSTIGRLVLGLLRPTAGNVTFDGRDLNALSRPELTAERRRLQIIFQDPYSSLDPRMKVGDIIAEGLIVHRIGDRSSRTAAVERLLKQVGLSPRDAGRFPHQFSGGQRQRIGIARALATDPDFVVCDEAVSALDVSIQAQIVNLLRELQRERGLSYLFISHDLNVVRYIADRICVMYLGQLVETAPTDELFANPRHPYTRALLSAIPQLDAEASMGERVRLSGEVPSPANPPSGCRFHPRCPHPVPESAERRPDLVAVGEGHAVAACPCFM